MSEARCGARARNIPRVASLIGVNKAVVPGESTEEPVKPLRGECRMFPVLPL